MNKSSRKPRSDSVSEMTRIMQGAKREMAPPSHIPLQDQDWPFFESILAEYASAEWSEHNLECAAIMARCMADLEENQRLLREEGATCTREIKDGKGNIKRIVSFENARARSVATLMTQVLAMRRSLALHARGKSGTNTDAANKREANKATERNAQGGDSLLS